MRMPLPFKSCKAAFLALIICVGSSPAVRAEWQRTDISLGWLDGTNLVWQFNFDPAKGKTYFHPLAVAGGPSLTESQPPDHKWHYGLWFSWKFINQLNYWEEDRATGLAEGSTRWSTPKIKCRADGSATVKFEVKYVNPSNRVEMGESRVLTISAAKPDGSYTIDWSAKFKAGKAGAVLDRTPMPSEPGGQVNGGYAGLGLRLAPPPLMMSVLCSTGAVEHFETDRARPTAAALACNLSDNGKPAGGIAILSAPENAGDSPPWYIVNSDKMRFACAAILAPSIRTLKPRERMSLHYLIAIQRNPWTTNALEAAKAGWR